MMVMAKITQQQIIKQIICYSILNNSKAKLSWRNGLCNGFSVVQSYMRVIGKQAWWQALCFTLTRWDGDQKSLARIIDLPDENQNKPAEEKTLGYYFECAIHYILFHQAQFYQTSTEALSQENLLVADGWFDSQEKGRIRFYHHYAKQRHTIESLEILLDPLTFSKENTLYLLHLYKKTFGFFEESHATSIFYDVNTECWQLYDPEKDIKEEYFTSVAALFYTLRDRYGELKISIEIASFSKDFALEKNPHVLTIREQLQSLQRQLHCLAYHYSHKMQRDPKSGFTEGLFGKCYSAKTKLAATKTLMRAVDDALSHAVIYDKKSFDPAVHNGKLLEIYQKLMRIYNDRVLINPTIN